MNEVVIVSAKRTATGAFMGSLLIRSEINEQG